MPMYVLQIWFFAMISLIRLITFASPKINKRKQVCKKLSNRIHKIMFYYMVVLSP